MAFTLIPAESRRLIEKTVVLVDAIKSVVQKTYIVLTRGTTIRSFAQEFFRMKGFELQVSNSGPCTHRLLSVIEVDKQPSAPIILQKAWKGLDDLPSGSAGGSPNHNQKGDTNEGM